MKKLSLISILISSIVAPVSLQAEYSDIVDFFSSIQSTSTFVVQNQNLSAVESAFGVRKQTSTGLYDWHRGIDIDGNLDSDLIFAPIDGYFYDYRETASGGYIFIMEHHFADFNGGAVTSIQYDPDNTPATVNSQTKFYTWYMHLSDDGIDNNGSGSFDLFASSYTKGDPISQGTTLGILGNSGSPGGGLVYGPHLHFELRVGSISSLDYQGKNDTTQYGFDPHMNPYLLFDINTHGSQNPNTYTQSIDLTQPVTPGEDIELLYIIDNDETPLLNRFDVEILAVSDDSVQKSHALDFNTREGFDASTNENLVIQDTSKPYIEPIPFGDAATEYKTSMVIPNSYLSGYQTSDYKVKVTATDLYGNSVTKIFAAIPEPKETAIVFLIAAAMGICFIKRKRSR